MVRPPPTPLPALSTEETKLISQFRMTYTEASEALANNSSIDDTGRQNKSERPWKAHSVVRRGVKSLKPPSNKALWARGNPDVIVRPSELQRMDSKADVTETTIEGTEVSESVEPDCSGISENAEPKIGELHKDEGVLSTAPSGESTSNATISSTATAKSSRRDEGTPTRSTSAFPSRPSCYTTHSLERKLMRDYDLTYAKARSFIKEAQRMLGRDAIIDKELERRCRSLILFKGKDDFRNLVLRPVSSGDAERSNEHSAHVVKRTDRTLGKPSMENVIMNQYKMAYTSARRLADAARDELGMKPWDQWSDEIRETCDRLYGETSVDMLASPSWSKSTVSAVEDAKRFFESYCNRSCAETDAVFRRMDQETSDCEQQTSNGNQNGREESIEVEFLPSKASNVEMSTVSFTSQPKARQPYDHDHHINESQESIEIGLGTNICDEKSCAETIHVIYESDEKDDSSTCTLDDSITHVGDVVEIGSSAVRQSRVETVKCKNTSPAKKGLAGATQDITEARHHNPISTKIRLDKKAWKKSAYSTSLSDTGDHSSKTVRIKNTKKSANRKKTAGRCKASDAAALPATKEVPCQSANDEGINDSSASNESTSTHPARALEPSKKDKDCPKEEILEAILMSRFGASYTTAVRVAAEARKSSNFPEWMKWNNILLAECERRLKELNHESNGGKSRVTAGAKGPQRKEMNNSPTNHCNKVDNKMSRSLCVAKPACGPTRASTKSLAECERQLRDIDDESDGGDSQGTVDAKFSRDIGSLYQKTELSTSHRGTSLNVDSGLSAKGSFTVTDSGSMLSGYKAGPCQQLGTAEAMARPLETTLIRRHNISWNMATNVVQRGRKSLGMTESEAWTPQLEDYCEQELLEASSGVCSFKASEATVASSLAETRSIVVSVAATSAPDHDTEVGKDWTEHTLDDCSQVSRCPSQANDFVIVEDASYSSESSKILSQENCYYKSQEEPESPDDETPDQTGVPMMIVLDSCMFPEVPNDEPLEARVGIPFISRRGPGKQRRSKHSLVNRIRRSLRRFRKKAIGFRPNRLVEDDTECREQTLMSV